MLLYYIAAIKFHCLHMTTIYSFHLIIKKYIFIFVDWCYIVAIKIDAIDCLTIIRLMLLYYIVAIKFNCSSACMWWQFTIKKIFVISLYVGWCCCIVLLLLNSIASNSDNNLFVSFCYKKIYLYVDWFCYVILLLYY